jgi:elongation factor 4
MKQVSDAKIGDTFYSEGTNIESYPGYEMPQAVVFAGVYPEDPDDYEDLEKALKQLCLTDSSVRLQPEASAALGSGFRCGFLGMLHMDVFRQRLFEEHDISAIMTQPNVSYYAKLRGKPESENVRVDNPAESPKPELISGWRECIVRATIITPREYHKGVKELCENRRGQCKDEQYMNGGRVLNLTYELPLSELITDFFDMLKSLSQGYASLDYEQDRYQDSDISKVVFHLNGDPVDALTFLVHDSRIIEFSKGYARKLRDILPP